MVRHLAQKAGNRQDQRAAQIRGLLVNSVYWKAGGGPKVEAAELPFQFDRGWTSLHPFDCPYPARSREVNGMPNPAIAD